MMKIVEQYLFDPTIGKIVVVCIGLAIIYSLVRFAKAKISPRIKDNASRYRTNKFISFAGYLLGIVLLGVVYSKKLGGFTVAFGIAGAGIAFALQEVIASFAGWLAILFGGFYKTGDRVQLGGIKGDVMDIGVLRTTIMETGQWVDGDLYNGRIVLIANSFVFKEPVFNYSGNFPFLWDEIKVPIQYGSNYERTQEILLAAGKKVTGNLPQGAHEQWADLQIRYRLEDAITEPQVSLIANDNWVEFTLRYVVDYKLRRSTKTALFLEILKEVDATGGEIKFASATFQLVESPDFGVKVNAK
ncbi:MAG: mechanosensitive ion channel [Taibaiella sp.]|nr:mechanosensitive ion channel [Taibaiella sp.]